MIQMASEILFSVKHRGAQKNKNNLQGGQFMRGNTHVYISQKEICK